METIEKIVDRNWFQLTDDNQTAFIQIFGNSDVCCGDDMPDRIMQHIAL
ncbi:hypothetical protein LA938_000362 [Salmonella enterica subsp. enterica serovar Mikawasima]|nr:hypothetical protein [Salmonella enterica subsp. enterica serovar Mikawasima]EID1816873.1 hypothetical protein [Salmonella enterica subsp. enterica serovar Mikawasima]